MSLVCLFVLSVVAPLFCSAQTITIAEAHIQFSLPSDKWKLADKQESGDKTIYFYKREGIINSKGQSVIANVSIIVESVSDSADLVMYSVEKRMSAPFSVKKMYSHDDKDSVLHHKYAIGYLGTYSDNDKREHTVYVVHLIHDAKGVQIICDVTSDLFSQCKEDFLTVLASIANAH